jgi:predicted nucleotidyltransferase
MTHCVSADRPVDPATVAMLRVVDTAMVELRMPYFIAGATARDMLLTHVFGIPTIRATLDVDLAVAVESWERFESLKARLAELKAFEADRKAVYRLHYISEGGRAGSPLDIIPFRGVEEEGNTIRWPPEMAIVMNVVGYEEALAASVPVQVAPGLTINVASLPGLAILKLFAWLDRGSETPKDAQDFVVLLRSYSGAGNEDRLYTDELALLESVGFDVDVAGGILLGKDVKAIAESGTLEKLNRLLADQGITDRLITHMAAELRAADDSVSAAEDLLRHFQKGLGL